MVNIEIRAALEKHHIKHWKVARKMGISEFTFSRWLRQELQNGKRAAVLEAINACIADSDTS